MPCRLIEAEATLVSEQLNNSSQNEVVEESAPRFEANSLVLVNR